MANIAFDTTASATEGFLSSPVTFSHVCTGSNLLLLVMIKENNNDTISGVTYNGVAMTQLKKETGTGSPIYIYGLLNPATGSNTVSISFTGGTQFIRAVSASYTGVNQTGLPDATASTVNVGTSALATTITTVADNCWVAGITDYDSLSSITNGTSRVSSASNVSLFDTNSAVTPAGNKTLTVNGTNVRDNTLVSFAPAPSATTAFDTSYSFFM